MILVEAGPLIALIHADDQQHEHCKEVFHSLREPMGTVWPVLTEAMYLLSFFWRAQDALWEMMLENLSNSLSDGSRPKPVSTRWFPQAPARRSRGTGL